MLQSKTLQLGSEETKPRYSEIHAASDLVELYSVLVKTEHTKVLRDKMTQNKCKDGTEPTSMSSDVAYDNRALSGTVKDHCNVRGKAPSSSHISPYMLSLIGSNQEID